MGCYMTNVELLEAAIKELKLQKKLIRKAFTHDPTLYRAWVGAVLPSLKAVIEQALVHEKMGWGASVPVLALAKAILGVK